MAKLKKKALGALRRVKSAKDLKKGEILLERVSKLKRHKKGSAHKSSHKK